MEATARNRQLAGTRAQELQGPDAEFSPNLIYAKCGQVVDRVSKAFGTGIPTAEYWGLRCEDVGVQTDAQDTPYGNDNSLAGSYIATMLVDPTAACVEGSHDLCAVGPEGIVYREEYEDAAGGVFRSVAEFCEQLGIADAPLKLHACSLAEDHEVDIMANYIMGNRAEAATSASRLRRESRTRIDNLAGVAGDRIRKIMREVCFVPTDA